MQRLRSQFDLNPILNAHHILVHSFSIVSTNLSNQSTYLGYAIKALTVFYDIARCKIC